MKEEKEKRVQDEIERIKTDPRIKPIVKNALYSTTLFLFTLGTLLRTRYRLLGLELDTDLIEIGKPKWMEKDGNVSRNLKLYTRSAATILTMAYRDASEKPGFAHRNWFRKQTTLEEVKNRTDTMAFDYTDLQGILKHD